MSGAARVTINSITSVIGLLGLLTLHGSLTGSLTGAAVAADLQEQRTLQQQLARQQQAVLEQRLRCIEQATSLGALQACKSSYPSGMHHGAAAGGATGMHGWGWPCPMW